MKELMQDILAIDQKQDQRLKDMKRKKEDIFAEIAQQAKQIPIELEQYAYERLSALEAVEAQDTNEKIALMQQAGEQDKQRIKKLYDVAPQLVQQIFQVITAPAE